MTNAAVTPHSGQAVAIGGSIGGLCAARALQRRFAHVTILEADVLPTTPQGRKGTPQAWRNHFLLAAGREAIESLFPGFTQHLLDSGGCEIDPGMQAANCLLTAGQPGRRPVCECCLRPVPWWS
jgi:hypothetical protein